MYMLNKRIIFATLIVTVLSFSLDFLIQIIIIGEPDISMESIIKRLVFYSMIGFGTTYFFEKMKFSQKSN